ncbi:hypothetical protein [Ilumatobacter sp.]|uniref:hypothetical protein n=1 Tax=Ilumatobacter sp. TaxID=1967498 RepID=UPI003C57257A
MPDRLDRDDVSRILARAHEIETRHASGEGLDDETGVEPEALIAAADEVGIDPNAVRDSLAIDRLALESPDARRLDRLAGPNVVVVEREVPLHVADAITELETWLTAVHRLVCDRRTDAGLHARPRTDTSARVGRTIAGWRGDGRLAGVSSLDIEAVPQVVGSSPDRPRTLVRIRADRHDARTVRLAGGGTVGLAGAGAGAATLAGNMVIVAPVVALPLMMGGYLVARSGRGHADRLELELERLITRVARGERPEGLLGRTVRRARRSVS